MKEFLSGEELRVLSHSNKGLRAEGTESRKRRMLLLMNRSQREYGQLDFAGSTLNRLMGIGGEEQGMIRKIINEQEHANQSFLTVDAFQELTLYLSILLKRVRQGELVESQGASHNLRCPMASGLLKYLAQYSRQFIEAVSRTLELDFNNDYVFYENLSNHLQNPRFRDMLEQCRTLAGRAGQQAYSLFCAGSGPNGRVPVKISAHLCEIHLTVFGRVPLLSFSYKEMERKGEMNMKAGVVHAANDIRFEEIETPKPGKGQVKIRVKYTGICGSDVPLVPCMKCADCQRGDYSLCRHYSFIGSGEYGSFAEYVVVPEKNAVPFGDEVSFEQGALFNRRP